MIKDEYIKSLKEQFSSDFGSNIDIRLDYHSYIGIIQSHLKSLFGERADWNNNLKRYYSSSEYKAQCHIARNIDVIPEVSIDEIRNQLDTEEKYNQLVNRVIELYESVLIPNKCSQEEYVTAIQEVENIIGLNPFYKGPTICWWMIDFDNFTESDMTRYKEALSKGALTYIIAKILCNEYIPGMQMDYPGAGITMLQRKSRYFYRGENAYYGKSQPSAYRHTDRKLNDTLQQNVDDLRCYEAVWMFLELDAVKHWGYSTPNYWALGQHYGVWTNLMDITTSLKTALFFACCKYVDGKWFPLDKNDFENKDSREYIADMGGDSRYGVIFTCPTEINMMHHGISDENQLFNVIQPVGFQPFMRCAAQSAYVLPVNDRSYDLYIDKQFSKVKFRLTEDICNWIYHEMKEGELIYPRNDVPDFTSKVKEINESRHFSKHTFDDLVKYAGFTEKYAEETKKLLKAHGYHILDFNKNYFTQNNVRKMNKKFTLDKAYELTQVKPVCSPMLILYGEQDSEGEV